MFCDHSRLALGTQSGGSKSHEKKMRRTLPQGLFGKSQSDPRTHLATMFESLCSHFEDLDPFCEQFEGKNCRKKWTEANSSKLWQKKANASKYGPTAAKCTLYVFSVLLDICAVLADLALLRFPCLQKVPETCPGCSRTSCDDHSSISSRGRRNGGVAI